MNWIFAILSFQAVIGAFDNFWHHELEAKLPQRVSARRELTLHAAREAIYGVLFLGLAWARWQGIWAWALAALLAAEIVITLADFIEEDISRRLPPLERVLHTILAVSYGAFVAALAPVLWLWRALPNAVAADAHGAMSWLLTAYGIAVLAWSLRNGLAVRRLARMAAQVACEPGMRPAAGPAVLVTGGTGFIGAALVRALVADGRRVIVLSRDARRASGCLGQAVQIIESLDALPSEAPVTAVVNLAGAPIMGFWWTPRRREQLLRSRVETTRALVAAMRRFTQPPGVLVTASAVGYYGVRADLHEVDETAPAQPGDFASDLCVAWEREAAAARALGVRVVKLRFGIVLGAGGGVLPLMLLATRLRLGAIMGTGRQAMPWLHLDDAIGLIRFAIERPAIDGAVNAVAPEAVTQPGFAVAVGKALGVRVRLRVPGWVLRGVGGAAAAILLEGMAVAPRAALAGGYRYHYKTLASALAAVVASMGAATSWPPAKVGSRAEAEARQLPGAWTQKANVRAGGWPRKSAR
jgi:uncharacterized protein (TIGR01777 family)